MTVQVDHTDPYNQRYVTTILPVTAGKQITTEIYTPFVYDQPLQVRTIIGDDNITSIEVFGMITTQIQTFSPTDVLIAEGQSFEQAWIEVSRSCMPLPTQQLVHTIDYQITASIGYTVTSGPALVAPGDANQTVWSALDGGGAPINPGPGMTGFEFIDVWA